MPSKRNLLGIFFILKIDLCIGKYKFLYECLGIRAARSRSRSDPSVKVVERLLSLRARKRLSRTNVLTVRKRSDSNERARMRFS